MIDLPEDWQNRVLEQVKERYRHHVRFQHGRRLVSNTIDLSPEFLAHLHEACRRRDINRASYMRRALACQVAADLDLDWRTLVTDNPRPGPWGSRPNNPRRYDDGKGFGDWP